VSGGSNSVKSLSRGSRLPGGALSPDRYSLTLGIPVQHCAEAIGGTANNAKLGNVVEQSGTTQRILPHAIAQKFETSSSGALIPATHGSTKAVTVTVTNAGIAAVEQFELRRP
jgi:hypothetical protein